MSPKPKLKLIFPKIANSTPDLGQHIVGGGVGVTRGYKDGLQPETLADGNWLVKQNQPVSKIETKSDTNLRSLYES